MILNRINNDNIPKEINTVINIADISAEIGSKILNKDVKLVQKNVVVRIKI